MRACLVLILLLLATSGHGEDPGLDGDAQSRLMDRAAELVRDQYVFADVAERAAAALFTLADSAAAGVPCTAEDFAVRLSGHLLQLTGDKHVRARLAGAISDTPDSTFGIRGVEVLDDGIGYLRLDRFFRADECRTAYDAALARLAGCRAVIVDLTANGGGSDANMLLASYFLGERTMMNRIEWRHGEPLEFQAGPSTIPALVDVPLCILISGRTFSAAEGVAYALQQMGRAVIVGEASKGGANPNRWFPLGDGLEISISIGRTVNLVSGTNWEGAGVQPDVVAPPASSLAKARELLARR